MSLPPHPRVAYLFLVRSQASLATPSLGRVKKVFLSRGAFLKNGTFVLAQIVGSGDGPKNKRNIFSLPITRASSCTVQ